MCNELVYKGNMLFTFKSLIKGYLVLIICIIRVPICPNNKLGASCRGKRNNALQINKFLYSGFKTYFITNCGMEHSKEEHIRKIPKPVAFECHFRPCEKFKIQQEITKLPESLSQTETSSS